MKKRVVRRKPNPPPYPRPLSDFVIDELPPTSLDFAWDALNGAGYYSDKDNLAQDEDEDGRRAAKRRRIEICAQASLRGEPLYIMSARLKGPLNKGWQNPWRGKRKVVKVEKKSKRDPVEIPETSKKTIPSVNEAAAARIPVPTVQSQPVSQQSLRTDVSVASPSRPVAPAPAPSPFTTRVTHITHKMLPKVPRKTKEKLVQEWLRTNDTLPKQNGVLVHSSPTPAASRKKTPGPYQDLGSKSRTSQSEPPKMAIPVVDLPRTIASVQEPSLHYPTRAEQQVQRLSRNMQNIMSEPVADPSHDLQEEVRKLTNPSSSSKSVHDSSRAEFAILRAKRSIRQTAPAEGHMSPFEFKKIAGHGGPQNKQREAPSLRDTSTSEAAPKHSKPAPVDAEGLRNDAVNITGALAPQPREDKAVDDVFATAPQPQTETRVAGGLESNNLENARGQSRQAASVPYPALSNAVSDASAADMLPSAQPRPELETSLSNVVRDERLLSIKNVSNVTENAMQHDEVNKGKEKDVVMMTTIEGKLNGEPVLKEQEIVKENNATVTPVPARVVVELSTQEMLANIEPLEMSTIKKLKSSPKATIPLTTTKSRPDKKRKRTSFAVDYPPVSSHSSIQNVMKAKVIKKLGSSPLFLHGKPDLDVESSDDENKPQHKRPRKLSGVNKPKGILRCTNPSSSPTSQRKSKVGQSTGQEQDGEQRRLPPGSGQNELNEDNFDLDAAIDDLGSFLGTWDVEKEASSLDIEA